MKIKNITMNTINFNKFAKLLKTVEKNINELNTLVSNLDLHVDLNLKKNSEQDEKMIVKEILDEILISVQKLNKTENNKINKIDKPDHDIEEYIEFFDTNNVNFFKCIPCDKQAKKSGLKKHLASKNHIINYNKFFE